MPKRLECLNYNPDVVGMSKYFSLECSASSLRGSSVGVRRFFSLTSFAPSELTEKEVRRVFNELVYLKHNASYISQVASAMRRYFKYLNSEGAALDKSIFDIKLPKVVQTPQMVIREEQANVILKQLQCHASTFAGLRNLVLVLTVMLTGARKCEVANLRVSDVDLENRFIRLWKTKTNKPRVVYICDLLFEHLEKYLLVRADTFPTTDALFLTRTGAALSINTVTGLPRDLRDRYGVVFKFHAFRRGFATELNAKGASLEEIANVLGHTCLETTRKYYIYCEDTKIKQTMSLSSFCSDEERARIAQDNNMVYDVVSKKYLYGSRENFVDAEEALMFKSFLEERRRSKDLQTELSQIIKNG